MQETPLKITLKPGEEHLSVQSRRKLLKNHSSVKSYRSKNGDLIFEVADGKRPSAYQTLTGKPQNPLKP